jgi:hypothetical protein
MSLSAGIAIQVCFIGRGNPAVQIVANAAEIRFAGHLFSSLGYFFVMIKKISLFARRVLFTASCSQRLARRGLLAATCSQLTD